MACNFLLCFRNLDKEVFKKSGNRGSKDSEINFLKIFMPKKNVYVTQTVFKKNQLIKIDQGQSNLD